MTNIGVSIYGTANLKSMHAEFGRLEAEVAALNAQLGNMVNRMASVDPKGFNNLSRAAAYNSQVFRDAAASTGMFRTQQVHLNSATDEYTKKLNAQKVSFREWYRQRKIANAAFKEQLAMEDMLVRRGPSNTRSARETFDVVTPIRGYRAELETAGRKLIWFTENVKSGSHQLVNWGKNTQWAGRQLTVGLTMPLIAFGAAAGVMAYQIDKELTRVRKVYDTTANQTTNNLQDVIAVQKELEEVTRMSMETARESARAYGAAATDTLAVQAELAATGKVGRDLQESTLEVMRISQLGELETDAAVNATVALQSVFRDTIKTAKDLGDAFNYINAIENATSLTTDDFVEAIPIAASAVRAWGGDVKELGILLTAMRENGIEASQGANALKATLQRLTRPSKQVREEWQQLTGTDITKITDDADNLIDVFTQIAHATENLTPAAQRKAFAGLFGSYQVGKLMAVTKGMRELEAGVGQVSDAYRIAGAGAEQWRITAENETRQMQESVSGRFKRALEEMKIQLATFGEPFVEAATTAMNAFNGIVDWFNGLPSIIKKGAGLATFFVAAAGPIIMLTGLLANLIAQGTGTLAGLVNWVARLAVKFDVLDEQSRIYQASVKMQEKSFQSQTKQVQGLTLELTKLADAWRVANQASAQLNVPTTAPRKSKAAMARDARIAEHQRLQNAMNAYAIERVDGSIYFGDERGRQIGRAEAERRARADLAVIDADIAKEREKAATASDDAAKSTEKTKRNLSGAAVAGAALSAGMLLTMTNSNETANNIGNWLVISAIAVPAAVELARVMKVIATWALVTEAATGRTALATKATAVWGATGGAAWKKMADYSKAVKAGGAMSLVTSLPLLASPLALIAGSVAAIGAGLWLWKRHMDKVREAEEKLHRDVNQLTEEWATKVGLVRKEYEKVAAVQRGVKEQTKYDKFLEAYNSGDLKAERDAMFSDEFSPEQRIEFARKHMAMLIQEFGLSMDDAALSLQAMYESAGRSISEADAIIKKFKEDFGSTITDTEPLTIYAEVMFDSNQTEETAHKNATDFGRAFAQQLSTAENSAQRQALMDYFQDIINVPWQTAWENLAAGDNDTVTAALREIGIDSGDELRRGIEEAGGLDNFVEMLFPVEKFGSQFQYLVRDILAQQVNPAIQQTTSIMGGLTGPRSPFSFLPSNINNMTQLAQSIDGVAVAAQGLPTERIRELLEVLANPAQRQSAYVQNIMPALTDLEKTVYGVNEETKLGVANALLLAGGYKQVTTWAEFLDFMAGRLPGKIDAATGAARRLGNAFAFSGEQVRQIAQEAMEATQQSFADDYSNYMNEQYDADLDNTRAYWDKKVDQVGNAGEAARDRLDAAWEKRIAGAEKYWDRRIEMVDKALEAEQRAEEQREKMFDAEVARIQKLNDLANANIDFNVALNEGKLDEAARLRNDLEAQSSVEAIERARAQVANQSERRQRRLEKRQERLEKQRDAALDALRKQEEAQKASLDRQIEANRNAVEQQRDDAIAAKEAEIEAQKKALEKEIRMFMAGTASSKAELIKRMKDAGINYRDFYRDVIKPTGMKWGEYFDQTLRENMRESADAIRNADYWETLGNDAIGKMARGMGFSGKRGLMHFLKTGEIKEFHENTPAKPGNNPGSGAHGPGNTTIPEGRHEGGEIGKGLGSRKGVARTYRGIHPSETLITALPGEYVINREAYQKNKGIVQAINAGKAVGDDKGIGGIGPGMGPAPFFGAAFARGIASKTSAALSQAVDRKRTEMAALAAAMSAGGPFMGAFGNYSLPGVKPWVLEAANYLGGKYGIGSILGVGMRSSNPTSDHPKGLALDFMTGAAVEKGWALAREALRLQSVLDATYMIFQGKIHSFDSRGWRPYSHPSGATDPTSMHMDHVHISFSAAGKAGDLPRPAGAGTGTNYLAGPGGRHRPVRGGGITQGLHFNNAIDIGVNEGTPVYAIADGRVSGSYDIPGHEPRAPHGGLGYRSYGRVVTIDHGGFSSLYAHLSARGVAAGQRVAGGSRIALSGNTGYSRGPHLHFGVTGGPSPYDFMGLRKGAMEVKYDNTLARLHKGEGVMTKRINTQIKQGAELFANGGGTGDTYNMYPSPGMDEEAFANKVVKKIDRRKRRLALSRTVGKV